MPKFEVRSNALLTPIILACLAFLVVVGFQSVNPTNISWLQVGDPAQHYYGWAFFRHGPWTWPIGLNPQFGGALSSSIVYTDSIPLLAILFKPFSAVLPEPFQYLGLFIFICFILQAISSWKLIGLFSQNYFVLICTTLLMIFFPPMLGRTVMTTSLAAHFLILVSLYLALRKKQSSRIQDWALLLCMAALIHAYLLGMVLAIWFGSYLDFCLHHRSESLQKAKEHSPAKISALIEPGLLLVVLALICWQAGYFAVPLGAGAAGNYGLNGLDLLAFFDPNGWSYLLRFGTPFLFHTADGFQYLGLGILFLIPFAITGIFKGGLKIFMQPLREHFFLLLLLLFLLAFSLTQNVHIGNWYFHYWLPDQVIQLASIFRASSRMVWPIGYILLLVMVWTITRSFSQKWVYSILAIAVILQIADTSAGWHPRRTELLRRVASHYHPALSSDFWDQAGHFYKETVQVPHKNAATGFEVVANYSLKHQMVTNAANFSRLDNGKLNQSNLELDAMIGDGRYKAESLYFLESDKVVSALATLRVGQDLFARVDNQYVLAPNWYPLNPHWQAPKNVKILTSESVSPRLGQPVLFNYDQMTPIYLTSGWSYPEVWGVWLKGQEGVVDLLLPQPPSHSVTLNLRALLNEQHLSRKVAISTEGASEKIYLLNRPQGNLIPIELNPSTLKAGHIKIYLRDPDRNTSLQPVSSGQSGGPSIGLMSATFH